MIRKLTVAVAAVAGVLLVPAVASADEYVKKNSQTVCWGECPPGPDPMMVIVPDSPEQEPQTPAWSPPEPTAVAPAQWPTAPAVHAPTWPSPPAVAWPTAVLVLDPTIRIRPAGGPF